MSSSEVEHWINSVDGKKGDVCRRACLIGLSRLKRIIGLRASSRQKFQTDQKQRAPAANEMFCVRFAANMHERRDKRCVCVCVLARLRR